MRTRTLVVALCVAAGGTAAAQPPPTDPPPDPTQPNPNPTPTPPPPQPNPAPPPTPAPMPVVQPEGPPVTDEARPTDLSIGIGVGYQFPTSLETPNITSVRFRLPSGLTFEPQLILANTTDTVDTGESVDDKRTELGLGSVIRYPLIQHGRVDLEFLGALNVNNVNSNPDGDDNNTSTTVLTLNYGLAVTSWITKHWQISMSAANPLVSFVKVRQEMGPMNVLVTSNTTLGAIFDPTVILMVHLYH
ncbi:MAG: hypothetical protein ABI867_32245 [Kofleriaceae bacterium]